MDEHSPFGQDVSVASAPYPSGALAPEQETAAPEQLDGGLALAAAWLGVAAAVVTFPAAALTVFAVVSSYRWRTHPTTDGKYEFVANGGAAAFMAGVAAGLVLAVLLVVVCRALLHRPGRAVKVLGGAGVAFAIVAALLLLAPGALLGQAPAAAVRDGQAGLSDAQVAGLALLAAAALSLAAALLGILAVSRSRSRPAP